MSDHNGVPSWMAALGVKPGDFLMMTKAQLRSQQRPDKPLKVQVWATGILHTAGYQGEEATTLHNGKRVPLSPANIINELHTAAKQFYARAEIQATPEQLAGLKETKEEIRSALEELETEGICTRTNRDRQPLRSLSLAQRRRLSGGQTRLFFWLTPRPADPEVVQREWERRQEQPTISDSEVGKSSLPIPPIQQILKIFQIEKPDKAQFTSPEYHARVERGYLLARRIFIEVVTGSLPGEEATSLPEVGTPAGAFERTRLNKEERADSSTQQETPRPPSNSQPPQNQDAAELCGILAHLQSQFPQTTFGSSEPLSLENKADRTTLGHILAALGSCPPLSFQVFLVGRIKGRGRQIPDKLGGFIEWARDCARWYAHQQTKGAHA